MDNRTIHDLFTNLRTQYIPACERRRRTESSQLKSRNVRKFKPLVWNKPSFTLGASKLENTAISSSDRLIVKRKAQVVEDDNISSSNCLDTIPSTPTSVFNSYGPSSYNKRQWSKKDVDGLLTLLINGFQDLNWRGGGGDHEQWTHRYHLRDWT